MEFLFEILFQIIGEVVFEGLFRLFKLPFAKRPHPMGAGIVYAIFGAVFGAISVWLFPSGFLPTPFLRIGYMIVVPIALGLLMIELRRLLGLATEWSKALQFSTTAIFAFTFALVRYLWIY